MKITLLILCFCLFFSVNVCALEAIDLENASIMEQEAFISIADQAESVLQEEKNHHTAEDMCEIAIEELKKCWAEDEFFINETTGYFQIIHTRVIYIYPSFENAPGIKEQEKLLEICRKIFSNENGSP